MIKMGSKFGLLQPLWLVGQGHDLVMERLSLVLTIIANYYLKEVRIYHFLCDVWKIRGKFEKLLFIIVTFSDSAHSTFSLYKSPISIFNTPIVPFRSRHPLKSNYKKDCKIQLISCLEVVYLLYLCPYLLIDSMLKGDTQLFGSFTFHFLFWRVETHFENKNVKEKRKIIIASMHVNSQRHSFRPSWKTRNGKGNWNHCQSRLRNSRSKRSIRHHW